VTTYNDVPPDRNPGVLIIDATCEAGCAFVLGLRARGWAVWLATDADTAVSMYALHADEIDVAMVDVQLPGLEGMRALNRLHEMNADLPCCATTSPVGRYAAAAFRRACDTPLFTKPLDPRSLSFTLIEMAVPVLRAGWRRPDDAFRPARLVAPPEAAMPRSRILPPARFALAAALLAGWSSPGASADADSQ
jgi:CheY-like chemotaxis protein